MSAAFAWLTVHVHPRLVRHPNPSDVVAVADRRAFLNSYSTVIDQELVHMNTPQTLTCVRRPRGPLGCTALEIYDHLYYCTAS